MFKLYSNFVPQFLRTRVLIFWPFVMYAGYRNTLVQDDANMALEEIKKNGVLAYYVDIGLKFATGKKTN